MTCYVQVTFKVEGLGSRLHVLAFQGEEALSRLFRFTLELASEDDDLPFDSVVGQPATLTLAPA